MDLEQGHHHWSLASFMHASMEQLEPSNFGRNLLIPSNCFGSSSSAGIPSIPSSPLPRPLSSPPRLSLSEGDLDGHVEESDRGVLDVLEQLKDCTTATDQNPETTSQTAQWFGFSNPSIEHPENFPSFLESSETIPDLVTENDNPRAGVSMLESPNNALSGASEIPAFHPDYPDEINNRRVIASQASPDLSSSGSKPKKRSLALNGEPEKLPRPPNSWILYRSDKIMEMKSSNQGLAQSVLSKEIAARWHSESPEIKKEYEKRAEIIKAEHAAKYPDYKYNPKRKKVPESKRAAPKPSPQSKMNSPRAPKGSSQSPSNSAHDDPRFPKKNQDGYDQAGLSNFENEGYDRYRSFDFLQPSSLEADLYRKYPLLGEMAHNFQSPQQQRPQGDIRVSESCDPFNSPQHSDGAERFTNTNPALTVNMSPLENWGMNSSSNPPSSSLGSSVSSRNSNRTNGIDVGVIHPLFRLNSEFSGEALTFNNFENLSSAISKESLTPSLSHQNCDYSSVFTSNPNLQTDHHQEQQSTPQNYSYQNPAGIPRVQWNPTGTQKQHVSNPGGTLMRENHHLNNSLSFQTPISFNPHQTHANHQHFFDSGSFEDGRSYNGMGMCDNGSRGIKIQDRSNDSTDNSSPNSASASASTTSIFQ